MNDKNITNYPNALSEMIQRPSPGGQEAEVYNTMWLIQSNLNIQTWNLITKTRLCVLHLEIIHIFFFIIHNWLQATKCIFTKERSHSIIPKNNITNVHLSDNIFAFHVLYTAD